MGWDVALLVVGAKRREHVALTQAGPWCRHEASSAVKASEQGDDTLLQTGCARNQCAELVVEDSSFIEIAAGPVFGQIEISAVEAGAECRREPGLQERWIVPLEPVEHLFQAGGCKDVLHHDRLQTAGAQTVEG